MKIDKTHDVMYYIKLHRSYKITAKEFINAVKGEEPTKLLKQQGLGIYGTRDYSKGYAVGRLIRLTITPFIWFGKVCKWLYQKVRSAKTNPTVDTSKTVTSENEQSLHSPFTDTSSVWKYLNTFGAYVGEFKRVNIGMALINIVLMLASDLIILPIALANAGISTIANIAINTATWLDNKYHFSEKLGMSTQGNSSKKMQVDTHRNTAHSSPNLESATTLTLPKNTKVTANHEEKVDAKVPSGPGGGG